MKQVLNWPRWAAVLLAWMLLPAPAAQAQSYVFVDPARGSLLGGTVFSAAPVALTPADLFSSLQSALNAVQADGKDEVNVVRFVAGTYDEALVLRAAELGGGGQAAPDLVLGTWNGDLLAPTLDSPGLVLLRGDVTVRNNAPLEVRLAPGLTLALDGPRTLDVQRDDAGYDVRFTGPGVLAFTGAGAGRIRVPQGGSIGGSRAGLSLGHLRIDQAEVVVVEGGALPGGARARLRLTQGLDVRRGTFRLADTLDVAFAPQQPADGVRLHVADSASVVGGTFYLDTSALPAQHFTATGGGHLAMRLVQTGTPGGSTGAWANRLAVHTLGGSAPSEVAGGPLLLSGTTRLEGGLVLAADGRLAADRLARIEGPVSVAGGALNLLTGAFVAGDFAASGAAVVSLGRRDATNRLVPDSLLADGLGGVTTIAGRAVLDFAAAPEARLELRCGEGHSLAFEGDVLAAALPPRADGRPGIAQCGQAAGGREVVRWAGTQRQNLSLESGFVLERAELAGENVKLNQIAAGAGLRVDETLALQRGVFDVEDPGGLDVAGAEVIRAGGRLAGQPLPAGSRPALVAYRGGGVFFTGPELSQGARLVLVEAPAGLVVASRPVQADAVALREGTFDLGGHALTLGSPQRDAVFVQGDGHLDLSAPGSHLVYAGRHNRLVYAGRRARQANEGGLEAEFPLDGTLDLVELRPWQAADTVGTVRLGANAEVGSLNVRSGTFDLGAATLFVRDDAQVNTPAVAAEWFVTVADTLGLPALAGRYDGAIVGTPAARLAFIGAGTSDLDVFVENEPGPGAKATARTRVTLPVLMAAKTRLGSNDPAEQQLRINLREGDPDGSIAATGARLQVAALEHAFGKVALRGLLEGQGLQSTPRAAAPPFTFDVEGAFRVSATALEFEDNGAYLRVGGDFEVLGTADGLTRASDGEHGAWMRLGGTIELNGAGPQRLRHRPDPDAYLHSLRLNGGVVQQEGAVFVGQDHGERPEGVLPQAPGAVALQAGRLVLSRGVLLTGAARTPASPDGPTRADTLFVVDATPARLDGALLRYGAVWPEGDSLSFVEGNVQLAMQEAGRYVLPLGIRDEGARTLTVRLNRRETTPMAALAYPRATTPQGEAGLPIVSPQEALRLDRLAPLAWVLRLSRVPALEPDVQARAGGLLRLGIDPFDELDEARVDLLRLVHRPANAPTQPWRLAGVYDGTEVDGDFSNDNFFIGDDPVVGMEGVRGWETALAWTFTMAADSRYGGAGGRAALQVIDALVDGGPVDVYVDGRREATLEAATHPATRFLNVPTRVALAVWPAAADTAATPALARTTLALGDGEDAVALLTGSLLGAPPPTWQVQRAVRRTAATPARVALLLAHAAPSAGAVDVRTLDATPAHAVLQSLAAGLAFGGFRAAPELAPEAFNVQVREAATGRELAVFWLDLRADDGDGLVAYLWHPSGGPLALRAVDADGALRQGAVVTGAEEPALPVAFTLHGNYPNPFNPTTTLRFDLPAAAQVHVEVFDLLGRRVATTPPAALAAGAGRTLPLSLALASGTYLYRVVATTAAGTQVRAGRLTLVQ